LGWGSVEPMTFLLGDGDGQPGLKLPKGWLCWKSWGRDEVRDGIPLRVSNLEGLLELVSLGGGGTPLLQPGSTYLEEFDRVRDVGKLGL